MQSGPGKIFLTPDLQHCKCPIQFLKLKYNMYFFVVAKINLSKTNVTFFSPSDGMVCFVWQREG
jgi:hypothetical protein